VFDPHRPLSSARVTAFVATADAARSRAFYENILGLRVLTDDVFATAYDCAGIQLRVQKVDAVQPHAFTALGWQVHDLERVIEGLGRNGVVVERFPGLVQDARGIWRAPSGARVAWFRDPDGNLLSLSEGAGPGARY
jgi:catechol 2,3-dioxygenase-like lactoylglutathione lyase family enzyme